MNSPKWFASITSSLSLLYLINDLSPINLQDALLSWVDEYAFFVSTVRKFLFEWIINFFNLRHPDWMSVSLNECHIFILSTIFLAAIIRASLEIRFVYDQKKPWWAFWEDEAPKKVKYRFKDIVYLSIFCFTLFMIFNFLPAFLLPGFLGFFIAFLGLLFIIFLSLCKDERIQFDEKENPFVEVEKGDPVPFYIPTGKLVRNQLSPVFLSLLIAIILNYTFFTTNFSHNLELHSFLQELNKSHLFVQNFTTWLRGYIDPSAMLS